MLNYMPITVANDRVYVVTDQLFICDIVSLTYQKKRSDNVS